ncbi:spore cortex biosynthesis protein YabQ [Candidatus Contubernalis alkaliaceticus]|uniref:spore cortex biosynthesis protein YabQ n=1 Tax=Candidatus Contubernalis alkaliaceticus TaxID=338645 RepID=UPI001F4C1AEF|nr:spore cortex biosynthesis protein YabQ [Candidatus Contubernalis alkalaceticus]UNC90710.1 spore cortex biosynthesis protein YabQ [Candidatus Contubernalis alkalaceticus]
MTVGNQFADLFFLICIGFISGFIFDFYHILKKYIRVTPWLRLILDFSLWLIITMITAFLLLLVNWGEVRLYIFLAMGGGLILYYVLFSPFVKRIYVFLIDRFLKITHFIIKIITRFFRFIFSPFVKILRRLCRPAYQKLVKLKNKIKNFYQPLGKILNKINHKRRIF